MTGFNPAYDIDYDVADDILPQPPLIAEMRQRKKSKSGAFGIFRAALHILRKRVDEKDAAETKKEKSSGGGDWRNIVQSMRPLQMPASPSRGGAASPALSWSGSSCGTMSQYASATNLRDLCNEDDEEERRDPDEVFDAIEVDEAIDAKAEEFIARFYKTIHHQNSIHRQDRGV
ncbi:hypothetical protein AAHA92_08804 [Salvia divinorum]|uniref:Uncharacterized protein n=1 Tax=Salvia divinorum TaxID=28513 RepID=A0ABD1HPH0_SALDI